MNSKWETTCTNPTIKNCKNIASKCWEKRMGVKTKIMVSNVNEIKLYVEIKEQNMISIHCKGLFD